MWAATADRSTWRRRVLRRVLHDYDTPSVAELSGSRTRTRAPGARIREQARAPGPAKAQVVL